MNYDELMADNNYKEIASLEYADIKSFIVSEIEKRSLWARVAMIYQIIGLLAFVLGVYKAFMSYFANQQSVDLWWLLGGFIFTFSVLIIIHELIHAIAYKYIGAKHLSFGMNLKKFIFYVQAEKEVLNYKQFKIVALAPTLTVFVLSLFGMIVFYKLPAFYFFIPIFAFHSIFCAGDFGLLSFFSNRQNLEIVTFDIKAEGKTYFYGKENV